MSGVLAGGKQINSFKMSTSAWKKPDEVMRQMRLKKRALQARFSNSETIVSNQTIEDLDKVDESVPKSPVAAVKRKNPFR